MVQLARMLALKGISVHFAVEEDMSEQRLALGWTATSVSEVSFHRFTTVIEIKQILMKLRPDAIHITQGIRANGQVALVQNELMAMRAAHYAIMESVDLRGISQFIKPLLYAKNFWRLRNSLLGIMAIGRGTDSWIRRLAPKKIKVIPFAYFLEPIDTTFTPIRPQEFHFIFVGGLIKRKRVDLLIDALSKVNQAPFHLLIVGDGPERNNLTKQAELKLPGKVSFSGVLPMEATLRTIATADCLVLPSDHDGWGAVVSEAQIRGVQAICSSKCGASETIHSSLGGSVFEAGSIQSLTKSLENLLRHGRPNSDQRNELQKWAFCLTADYGANYLINQLFQSSSEGLPTELPWRAPAQRIVRGS
jgi:glycosyltransferase involved in cell wall biosynthesis